MPLITVKVFKDELNAQQSAELIAKLTDSFCQVTSDKLKDATWVQIEEINDGKWGLGGHAMSLAHVQKMMAQSE